MDEARACLTAGEALLRQVGATDALGGLLCSRVRLDMAEGRIEAARAALAEAEALAAAHQAHAGPDSSRARLLAWARAAVEDR